MKFVSLLHHTDENVVERAYLNGTCSMFSIQGHQKELNEDVVMIGIAKQRIQCLWVADGMGGHPCGDQAAQKVMEVFSENYHKKAKVKIDDELFATLDQCNRSVQKIHPDCGTTLCMAILDGPSVRFINVGDSLGLVLDPKGLPLYSTFEESSQGFADELEIEFSEQFLLNYMGFERVSFQVSPQIPLKKTDKIFLMSDGAHEFFAKGDEVNIEGLKGRLVKNRELFDYTDDATLVCFERK